MADRRPASLLEAQMSVNRYHIEALGQVVQPLFGRPEYYVQTDKDFDLLLTHIKEVYQSLEAKVGRPLRVLDLGCRLGYFAFNLADIGADVFAVDPEETHIDVCKALAADHPELKVRFERSLSEQVIVTMKQDAYDLVLALGAFDRLVYTVGVSLVQELISVLAGSSAIGIYEIATSNNVVEGGISGYSKPRDLLKAYTFVHEFSPIPGQPSLFAASHHFWYIDGSLDPLVTWKDGSRTLLNGEPCHSRQTFLSKTNILKQVRLDIEECRQENLTDFHHELAFLKSPPEMFEAPKLLAYGLHENEAWMVRELLEGELLSDKIRNKQPYDAYGVVQDVLNKLVALEQTGRYHNDCRVWNVLVNAYGRATLIDYAAITSEQRDRGWPYNLYLSFIGFIHEVTAGVVLKYTPIRQFSYNPDTYPEPYRSVLWHMFGADVDKWSFSFFKDAFARQRALNVPVSRETAKGFVAVLNSMDEALEIQRDNARFWRRNAEQAHALIPKFPKTVPGGI